jgi:hypothetical protein
MLIIVVIFLAGCQKPKEDFAAQKAVEDVLGKTTLKQGEMMKKKLKKFEKAQEKRAKELDKIK